MAENKKKVLTPMDLKGMSPKEKNRALKLEALQNEENAELEKKAKKAEKKRVINDKKAEVKDTVAKTKTSVKEKKETAKAAVGAKKAEVKEAVDNKKAEITEKSAAKKEELKEKTARVKEKVAEKVLDINTLTVLQFQNEDFDLEALKKKVKKAVKDSGKKEKDIKSLDLYIKVEERKVYYVVNGEGDGSFVEF